MKAVKMLTGEKLFAVLMKMTFYGHFVAGEDQYKIRPNLERLRSFGVKPILDYSVEEDLTQEEAEQREVAWVRIWDIQMLHILHIFILANLGRIAQGVPI